jgi:hypothetical protein
MWWLMPIILAPGRHRQEHHKFEASLGYIARSCLKNKNKTNKKRKTYERIYPEIVMSTYITTRKLKVLH